MPIIKSAAKKMRKDKKRTVKNNRVITSYKETLKKIKKGGSGIKAMISKFYSQVDRAVASKVIHKNKGRRLKARAGKLSTKK